MDRFGIQFTADEKLLETLQDKDPVTQSALRMAFYKKEIIALLHRMRQQRIRMDILISNESDGFMVNYARVQVRNILREYFLKNKRGRIITMLPITTTSVRERNND